MSQSPLSLLSPLFFRSNLTSKPQKRSSRRQKGLGDSFNWNVRGTCQTNDSTECVVLPPYMPPKSFAKPSVRTSPSWSVFHSLILLCGRRDQSRCKTDANKAKQLNGRSSSGNTLPHAFGWRDMYDTITKWRQISEPNDPVWWVDLLSPEQFREGFGSHTPMITGFPSLSLLISLS